MKGLVGGGELARLLKNPAWVNEKARLRHKTEMTEVKSVMVVVELESFCDDYDGYL